MPKPLNLPVKPAREVIDNTDRVEAFRLAGGKLIHIHSNRKAGRGMTIAYVAKSGRVEIATSVQHRNDAFTKKIGTKIALDHFDAGKTVCLPLSGRGLTNKLKFVFDAIPYA